MKEILLNFLRKLSCLHTWETYFESETCFKERKLPYAIEHTLICKKCGKIKKIKV